MIKNLLSILLALSARSPSSEVSYSTKRATFDGEDTYVTTKVANTTTYRVGHPEFADLDDGTADPPTAVNACENSLHLNVTAPDHPRIEGCYAKQEVASLYAPAGFKQYDRVPCAHGVGGSVGGIRVVRMEPHNKIDVRVASGVTRGGASCCYWSMSYDIPYTEYPRHCEVVDNISLGSLTGKSRHTNLTTVAVWG